MADIAPGASYAEAVKEIAQVIYLMFNGKNRQMLMNQKLAKARQKCVDFADEYILHDKPITAEVKKHYLKLRGKC